MVITIFFLALTSSAQLYPTPNEQFNLDIEFGDFTNSGNDWAGNCKYGMRQSPVYVNDTGVDSDVMRIVTPRNSSISTLMFNFPPEIPLGPSLSTPAGYFYGSSTNYPSSYLTAFGESHTFLLTDFRVVAPAEHIINGIRYSLELHTESMTYDPVNNATYSGLQIVTFFTLGSERNAMLDGIMNGVTAPLASIYPERGYWNNFYLYMGSMDFMFCAQGILWVLNPFPLSATRDQIDYFYNMYVYNSTFSNGRGNARGVKPLNGRYVYHVVPDTQED